MDPPAPPAFLDEGQGLRHLPARVLEQDMGIGGKLAVVGVENMPEHVGAGATAGKLDGHGSIGKAVR
jgi:hypothetical protein